jgi:DNA-binding transcriptional ArsR family regulator
LGDKDMVGPEEETYSTMFTSLKHPARRKILRILSIKPKTFSEILEELTISSSHLTYHLEHLGELVAKTENGTYILSTFGEAAVTAMREVEEVPNLESRSPMKLPLIWKSLFIIFMISIIILAGFSFIIYIDLDHVSSGYDQLELDYNQILNEHEKILGWSSSKDKPFVFLKDVIQLDMTKYYTRLVSNTIYYSTDLGGITEEHLKYSLTSDESELEADFRFRNQTLSRFRFNIIEGLPVFSEQKPINIIEISDGLLERYKNYSGAFYLEQMRNILKTADINEYTEIISGDIKLIISTEGKDTKVQWIKIADNIDFQVKGLELNFENGFLEMMTDGWFLFNVGSTKLNILEEEAINIAIENTKEYSWIVNGVEITEFTILENEVTAIMYPHLRENNLELIPCWVVNIPLDKVYPGNVDSIVVGVWADNGETTEVQTFSII